MKGVSPVKPPPPHRSYVRKRQTQNLSDEFGEQWRSTENEKTYSNAAENQGRTITSDKTSSNINRSSSSVATGGGGGRDGDVDGAFMKRADGSKIDRRGRNGAGGESGVAVNARTDTGAGVIAADLHIVGAEVGGGRYPPHTPLSTVQSQGRQPTPPRQAWQRKASEGASRVRNAGTEAVEVAAPTIEVMTSREGSCTVTGETGEKEDESGGYATEESDSLRTVVTKEVMSEPWGPVGGGTHRGNFAGGDGSAAAEVSADSFLRVSFATRRVNTGVEEVHTSHRHTLWSVVHGRAGVDT